jgi:benzoyl-CoA reductase subunit C
VTFDKFRHVVENRHDYAREWKSATGGKVCGCLCGNVPEEIIYASGMLPVRILGEEKTPTLAAAHMQDNRCAFCRGCLEEGLRGRYDYIDGLVYVHSCIATSQTYSSWVLHVPLAWSYRMDRPSRRDTPLGKENYRDCLEGFRLSLGEWLGSPISEEALAQSVATYRTNRQLMRQVYELRKMHPPLISGSDAKRMVLASMLMDKEKHNDLLQQLLQEKHEPRELDSSRVRVMIIGAGMDDVGFTELVESVGGDVVIDDHCLGLRYFWGNPVIDEDPMAAITSYYFDEKPDCPSQDWFGDRRMERLLWLAKEYDVETVIWLAQAFCGTHQWDIVDGAALFEKEGIPFLQLERDVTIPEGIFRNRIEATLEIAKGQLV